MLSILEKTKKKSENAEYVHPGVRQRSRVRVFTGVWMKTIV